MSDALLREHFAAKRARRVAFRDGRISARRVARLEATLRRLVAGPATPATVRRGNTVAAALVSARRIDTDVEAMCIDADMIAACTASAARRAGLL